MAARHTSRTHSEQSRRTLLRRLGLTGVGLATVATAASAAGDDSSGADDSLGGDDSAEQDGSSETDTSDSTDAETPTEIDSCTVIDEPGEYELVADLAPVELEQPGCIVIDADDVTLRGNGHTIDLSDTAYEGDFRYPDPSCIVVNPWDRGDEMVWETAVENVEVRGARAGILSRLNNGGSYTGITAVDNVDGFRFYVDGGLLEDCVLADNYRGIVLDGNPDIWGGSNASITGCTLQRNENAGLRVGHEGSADVTASRIVENGVGISLSAFNAGATVEGSHICRNDEYGVEAGSDPGYEDEWEPEPPRQAEVLATGNYWGAATGPASFGDPDEAFTDPETSRPADGDGDAISEGLEDGVSNVRFDPFAESPIGGVGAQR
ncbi:NosD domain-containing protein [Natrononativus amylolyticus]|uniref:NosD domain-containing protein n=1 Tax=Natrononativus amylolyticus TaxID=2963434 RepID=UPI0020CE7B8F|nr:right-handed parallel beta-helix repeat-containing protein [Natrononativus amylolyticus]